LFSGNFHLLIFQDNSEYWVVSNDEIVGEGKLSRGKCKLQGLGFDENTRSLITFCELYIFLVKKFIFIKILGSDSELVLFDVFESEDVPGKSLGKIENLKCQNKVGIAAVGTDHIVLYGFGPNETGLIFKFLYLLIIIAYATRQEASVFSSMQSTDFSKRR